MKRITNFALMMSLEWVGIAHAVSSLPPALQNVTFEQRLNEQVPLDLEFVDDAGRPVKLGDYFDDKPVILVLAYYRCPMLCTLVLNGLVQGMLDVPFDVGRDFRIVTVSFDARETPELAAAKKRTYIDRYGRPGAAEGWHFLTGTQPAIDRLTESVGFHYAYDAAHDEFAHASGIIVTTPSGRISRYFYDIRYSARDLRLGLVEASENRIGSPVDQVLLFCFHYDPREGRYGAAVMRFVRVGGALTLVSLVALLAYMWKRERANARTVHAPRPGDNDPVPIDHAAHQVERYVNVRPTPHA